MPRITKPRGKGEIRIYRSEGEHDRDLHIIEEMYLHGSSLEAIHQRVLENYKPDQVHADITLRTIENDLLVLRRRWLAASTIDFDELKSKELARLDGVERAYWEGWESSRQTKSIIEKEIADDQVAFSPKDPPIPIKRAKEKIKDETRDGDPRYLEGIIKCIEMRCKILGLFSPERSQSDWRILSLQAGLTEDESGKIYEDTVKKLMTDLAKKGGMKAKADEPLPPVGEILEAEFEMAEEE